MLEACRQTLTGPCLDYPLRHLRVHLRAFIDFVQTRREGFELTPALGAHLAPSRHPVPSKTVRPAGAPGPVVTPAAWRSARRAA